MEEHPVPQGVNLVADEMKDYFSSIEDSFEVSLTVSDKRGGFIDSVLIFSIVVCAFSVLPVIPAVLWGIIWRHASHWVVTIGGRALPTQSFFFWWALCVAISIPAAVICSKIDDRRSAQRANDSLKAAPMRFALCYAIVEEIDRCTKNRFTKHIAQAVFYWETLFPMLISILDYGGTDFREIRDYDASDVLDFETTAALHGAGIGVIRALRHPTFMGRIDRLQRIHPWFKLTPTTAKVIKAFNSLSTKITGRLKDKKDLPSVAVTLSNLATYLYCSIPEISSNGNRTSGETQQLSEQGLIRFADGIETLPPYSPEPLPLEGKEKVRFKLVLSCVS